MTINNLTLAYGYVVGSGFGGGNGGGGAIYNQDGNVTIQNSTLAGNTSTGSGGAITNFDDPVVFGGIMEIVNSTLIGNTAFRGGAIANNGSGGLSVINSTVVGNNAVTPLCPAGQFCATVISDGGGVANNGLGRLALVNSIVAGNNNVIKTPNGDLTSASDVYGFGFQGNNNLIGSPNGILGGLANGVNGNVIGIDVNTVVSTILADNGGSTPTLATVAGSPARDTASALDCPAADQRGIPRPQDSGCDIGAFETALSADLGVIQTAAPNPHSGARWRDMDNYCQQQGPGKCHSREAGRYFNRNSWLERN